MHTLNLIKKFVLASATVGLLASPVSVIPGETVALWNFNEASGNSVGDSSSDPLTGTAAATAIVDTESLMGSGFVRGRNFSTSGSYVDFGLVSGSKLDFTNKMAASVEAMIYLTQDVTAPVTIFDNREVQLQVVAGNRLGGYVKQAGGFKGVISSIALSKNTPYRVGLFYGSGHIAIAVDGMIVGNVTIPEAIASAETGAHILVGGDASGMNFPGIIDDIRVSNVAAIDNIPPEISLISPDLTVPTLNSSPNFEFSLTDNSGIDAGSIVIKLNNSVVTGLVFDPQTNLLSGTLSQPLRAGRRNSIEISVKDQVGNTISALYTISYINRDSGEEYVSDSDTLGLWHLNEFNSYIAKDSSSYARDGRYKGTEVFPGIIGQGRYFTSTDSISLPPIAIPGNSFTFETWIKPIVFNTGTVFDNGQIAVKLNTSGGVQVSLVAPDGTRNYTTVSSVLTLGDWNHVKVVYDGSLATENLLVLINGIVVDSFNAIANCQWDDAPKLATIGSSLNAVLDEVRLSKVARQSSNIKRGYAPQVDVAYPGTNVAVKTAKLKVYATFTDPSGINLSKVEVRLNGVLQTNLQVTSSSVSGELPSNLNPGVNDLEIRVTGVSGNQTIVQRRFFAYTDNSLQEYVTDPSTVALYHFNEPNGTDLPQDASGNNYHLNIGPSGSTVIPGKLGSARKITGYIFSSLDTIKFPGKSFTIEGWFAVPSTNLYLFNLSGTNFTAALSKENTNDLRVTLNLPYGGSISAAIKNVFKDANFHHYAYIYDGDAPHSNLIVMVDGEVVYRANARAVCSTCMSGTVNLQMVGLNGSVDEFRISSVARATFNIGSSSGPTIGFVGVQSEATIHNANPNISVLFEDDDSINQSSMSLTVNGVQETGLVASISGTSGTMTGALTVPLRPGANELIARAKDLNGNEQVQSLIVFYIGQGPAAPYSADADTIGLWHFNSPDLGLDSSANGANFTSAATLNATTGVFAQALVEFTGSSANLSATNANPVSTTRWTWEGWFRKGASTSGRGLLSDTTGTLLSIASNGVITYRVGSEQFTSGINTTLMDGNFHHVLLMADSTNPVRNAVVFIDGVAIASASSTVATRTFATIGVPTPVASLDEVRLSKTVRENFNFTKPTNLLFKNIKKLR